MTKQVMNDDRGVRIIRWVVPVFVLCIALAFNFQGINWAQLHPDEHLIAKWVVDTETQPFITDRAYPSGFFALYRPIRYVQKQSAKLSMLVQEWKQQDDGQGALSLKLPNVILNVRQINAVFMALSSFFVYWAARRIFAAVSKGASGVQSMLFAGLAAFIYGTHPFLVEHAHYAETDGTMVLTVAIVMALLTEALAVRQLRFFILASLMTGFAIGSKYTLMPLVVVLPACAVVLGRLCNWGVRRMLGLIVGALLLVLFGFCLATPSVYRDVAFFVRETRIASLSTWGEMNGLLGRMRDTPGAASAMKWSCFVKEVIALGIWRMAWLVLALPFWFVRPLRRYLMVFPLFLFCFPLAVVFVFPWFRNQEILPLLSVFSLTAVLPVAVLGFSRKHPFWRNMIATGALMVAISIAAANFADGSKMSSSFAGKESRMELGDWLDTCAPAGLRVGVERYAGRPGGYASVEDIPIGKVEIQPTNFFDLNEMDYTLCSPRYRSRGTVNPYTGSLYEDLAERLHAFNAQSILLQSWCLPEGPTHPVFSQTDVELRFVNRQGLDTTGLGNLDLCIDSPFLVNRGKYTHVVKDDGYLVGPQTAMYVAGRTSDIRFRGRHTGPWYGVAFVPQARNDGVPGDAELVWRSSGVHPRKAQVPFKGARSFTVTPSSKMSVFPKVRVKVRGDESRAVCLLALYSDPVPAARLLRKMGNPDEALSLLDQVGAAAWRKSAEVEAFLASVALGRESKSSWLAAAEHAVEVETVTAISGVPIEVLHDFSRLRIPRIPLGIHDRERAETGRWLFEGDIPMLLTPGRYRVKLQFHMLLNDWQRVGAALDQRVEFRLLPVDGASSSDSLTFNLVNGISDKLEIVWNISEPIIPRFGVAANVKCLPHEVSFPGLFVNQLEVVWDPVEQAVAMQEEIRAALRHRVKK